MVIPLTHKQAQVEVNLNESQMTRAIVVALERFRRDPGQPRVLRHFPRGRDGIRAHQHD